MMFCQNIVHIENYKWKCARNFSHPNDKAFSGREKPCLNEKLQAFLLYVWEKLPLQFAIACLVYMQNVI